MTDAESPNEGGLAAALSEVGVTQARFAELTTYMPSQISRWVSGMEPRRQNKAVLLQVLRELGWQGTSTDIWPVDAEDYGASCTRGH